jgi:hypothetical protein
MTATLFDFEAVDFDAAAGDIPGPAPIDPPAPVKLQCTRKGAKVSHVDCGGDVWPSGTVHWPGKGKILIGYSGVCERCRAKGNFLLHPAPFESPKPAKVAAPPAAPAAATALPAASSSDADPPADGKPRNLIQVITFCKAHDLPAEVVGRWVWLEFESKPSQEIRDLLKGAGFRWVAKRGKWAHNCGHHCRHGAGDPRAKYGAVPVGQFDDAA